MYKQEANTDCNKNSQSVFAVITPVGQINRYISYLIHIV